MTATNKQAPAEARHELEAIDRLISAGAGLANIAFNLAQVRALGAYTCRSLNEGRQEWDAALRAYRKARGEDA